MHALWDKQLECCDLLRKKKKFCVWDSSPRGMVVRNMRQLLCPELALGKSKRLELGICFLAKASDIYRNSNKGSFSSK